MPITAFYLLCRTAWSMQGPQLSKEILARCFTMYKTIFQKCRAYKEMYLSIYLEHLAGPVSCARLELRLALSLKIVRDKELLSIPMVVISK